MAKKKKTTEVVPVQAGKRELAPWDTLLADDVRKYFCPTASDKDIFMFMNIVKSYHLDPFKREIHLVKYDTVKPAQIVVGYEVYLKRAQMHSEYNGMKVWTEDDAKGGLLKACIEIYRKDWKEPFYWEAHRNEFTKGQATWRTMERFMLKKVVIGQGHRLAFSDWMGGMPYLPEEITDSVTSEDLPKKVIQPLVVKKGGEKDG